MPTDNGPSRDVSPASAPKFTKPDPHQSGDPGEPTRPEGKKGGYEGGYNPKLGYDFDETSSKV